MTAPTYRVVAHLALDGAGVSPIAAGDHPLLEDFVEDGIMKGLLLLRGERRLKPEVCGG